MASIKELRKQIRDSAKDKAFETKAVLGRADGVVKAGGQNVYVTLYNGDVLTVYNVSVPNKPFRKVIIGYVEGSEVLQVLRFDNVYDSSVLNDEVYVPHHKDSHRWFDLDPIEVTKEQFMELLPRAIGGMVVRVYGGEYVADGGFYLLNTREIDLSAEIPGSGAEWVNAEIDTSGVVSFTHGANKDSRSLLLPSDRAALDPLKHLLFSAKMYVGLVDFIQTRTDTDLFDPRFTGMSMGGGGGGSDASDITYTPANDSDWEFYLDPGNVDDALDQLAERVVLLEAGGGSYTDEQAQDAVGAMIDSTLVYTDATPLLSRAALTGEATASAGSNAITLTNSAVIAKVLTAFSAGAGTVTAADSILSAFQKVVGNIAAITITSLGGVPTSRTISTTAPLTGGGDLSADRTFAISAATESTAGSMSATDKKLLDDMLDPFMLMGA